MRKTRFEFTCPGADKVFLAGEFNAWSPQAQRLKRVKKGEDTFVALVDLAPGRYEYKYVVDGEWRCSPDAPCVPNEFGTENSVIEVCA
jgi:1,4-alpha-glucan branching enzyme